MEYLPGVETGSAFTQNAVNTIFPSLGGAFVSIALFFFAFTTIMAYYYIAETNLSYLIDKFGGNRWLIQGLRAMIIGATFYGSVKTATLAWTLGDIGVGLMAWLNIIAIFLLSEKGLAVFKDYEKQLKAGKDPVFKAKDIGINNAECWD